MRVEARLVTCGALVGLTALLMPHCSGGGCVGSGSAGHTEAEELGVAVPPAAPSALGAYAKTQRTPVNRALPATQVRQDGGIRRRRRPASSDAGVPL
jgi:hypothetical protein